LREKHPAPIVATYINDMSNLIEEQKTIATISTTNDVSIQTDLSAFDNGWDSIRSFGFANISSIKTPTQILTRAFGSTSNVRMPLAYPDVRILNQCLIASINQ
jgi:hypothetical protein